MPWLQKHGKHRIHCPVGTPLADKYPELQFPIAEQVHSLSMSRYTWPTALCCIHSPSVNRTLQ